MLNDKDIAIGWLSFHNLANPFCQVFCESGIHIREEIGQVEYYKGRCFRNSIPIGVIQLVKILKELMTKLAFKYRCQHLSPHIAHCDRDIYPIIAHLRCRIQKFFTESQAAGRRTTSDIYYLNIAMYRIHQGF